jgi:hypothetical protein
MKLQELYRVEYFNEYIYACPVSEAWSSLLPVYDSINNTSATMLIL